MKKVLIAVMLLAVMVGLCACSYSSSFMPRATVNSLVKKYPTPQAEVTITFERNSETYEYVITYDLLLEQAPVAVTRFIQLANDGAYDNSIVDNYNSANSYVVGGRYKALEREVEGKTDPETHYYVNNLGNTFVGEFATNKYREPADGYAKFAPYALAMYHPDLTASSLRSDCNTADGTLILALPGVRLNYLDYAVFATVNKSTFRVGENPWHNERTGTVDNTLHDNLRSFGSKSSHTIYDDLEETKSSKLSIMSTLVSLKVTILGDYDWSKLPKIG